MTDVVMCTYMLVIGEGREGETKKEREVYIYKYRENIKIKRDIQRNRDAHTHARDIKRKRETCTHTSHARVRAHTHTHTVYTHIVHVVVVRLFIGNQNRLVALHSVLCLGSRRGGRPPAQCNLSTHWVDKAVF